jgi:hypothetical protein
LKNGKQTGFTGQPTSFSGSPLDFSDFIVFKIYQILIFLIKLIGFWQTKKTDPDRFS